VNEPWILDAKGPTIRKISLPENDEKAIQLLVEQATGYSKSCVKQLQTGTGTDEI